MFQPNVTVEISIQGGSDGYGAKIYGQWRRAPAGIVKLEQRSEKTSVRTDSSATRGQAQEILADARLLFPKNIELKPGDRVRFANFYLTVVSVRPRISVQGEMDHWQVDLNIYGGP